METKELKIQVPEGYEIDKENSTFECIKFKKKAIDYIELIYSIGVEDVKLNIPSNSPNYYNKIYAINKLLFVSKYLNNGWVPDFDNHTQPKYFVIINDNKRVIGCSHSINREFGIYFKSEELAQQAIDILGEEVIKQALSPNY